MRRNAIGMMQHEDPSSRNDWSYYKPAGEDCQEKTAIPPAFQAPLETRKRIDFFVNLLLYQNCKSLPMEEKGTRSA